jgi:hypothetical protein
MGHRSLGLALQNAIPFTCERSAPKEQGACLARQRDKGSNYDGFLEHRARQVLTLVLRWHATGIGGLGLALETESTAAVPHRKDGNAPRFHLVDDAVLAVENLSNLLAANLRHHSAGLGELT